MALKIIPMSEEEIERVTTDKWKACVGCQYLSKDKGYSTILPKVKIEEAEVYHCGLGQFELTQNFGKEPEQCRARNLNKSNIQEERYMFRPETKVRNNCAICKVYSGNEEKDEKKAKKPWCEGAGIVFNFCPCKECDKFMASEDGCKNETKECQKLCKYEVKK